MKIARDNSMSEKCCVFCGEKPKDKNQEHVIPQWLIRMTDLGKKEVLNVHPDEDRHISFMHFTFPACTECNSRFSKMEATVKPVLERVLAGQSISGADASLLMDWFDKIRIGLWLANMYYDPQLKQAVKPHYYIDFAVAKKDRMLSIQKINLKPGEDKGMYFGGTKTPLFNYSPVAFTVLINDYYFFNASTHNLVSPRVGFPEIKSTTLKDGEKGLLEMDVDYNGRHKVVNPVIQTFTPNIDAITFYQPIYRDFIAEPGFPVDEYMAQHSYDTTKGLGGVFVQKGFAQKAKYMTENERVSMNLNPISKPDLAKDVLTFQNAIESKAIISSVDTRNGVMLNAMILKSMEKQK